MAPDEATTTDATGDEYNLSKDSVHEHPVEVKTTGTKGEEHEFGSDGISVHIEETFSDDSTTTVIYTEEQARKIRDRLNDVFDGE